MATDYLRDVLLTARMQARLCQAVYAGKQGVREMAAKTNCRFRWFEVGNNCAGALIFQDHIHLSICGSNDRYDWMQNADTHADKKGNFVAHRGFLRAATQLRDVIVDSDLPQYINGWPSKPLVIGGHSAGGAIAQLMALDAKLNPREIITFGAPKALAISSAAAYAVGPWEVHRFVMDGDIIPFMPLRIGAAILNRPRYAHTCIPVYLHEDGTIDADDTTILQLAWARMKQFTCLGFASLLAFTGIYRSVWKKHGIARYVAAIEKGVANA